MSRVGTPARLRQLPYRIERMGISVIDEKTTAVARELESHLAAMEISVNAGVMPHASTAMAREIMADLLKLLGLDAEPGLPPVTYDDPLDEIAQATDAVGLSTGQAQ